MFRLINYLNKMKSKLIDGHNDVTTVFIKMLLKAKLDKDESFCAPLRDNKNVADVILTVNGVELPFVEVLEDILKSEYARIDQLATQKAFDIMKDAGMEELSKIQQMIKDNGWAIKEKLEKLTGQKINDSEY